MSAPVPEVDAGLVEVLNETLLRMGFVVSTPPGARVERLARAVQGYVEGQVAAALEDAALAIESANDRLRLDVQANLGMARAARIVRSDARRSPETASTPDGGREGVRGGEGV